MVINRRKRADTPLMLSRAFTLFTLLSVPLLFGCGQIVRPLSAADSRLPSEAKQRIADAEDAVLIARSRFRDAKLNFERAIQRNIKFERKPPNLGAATILARQLNIAKVNLAELETRYATVNQKLSQNRLKLVYAQTSMRYDIAVYDLVPLDRSVDSLRTSLLELRKQKKKAQAEMKSIADKWWAAYQGLAQSSSTQDFWVHELVQ